MSRVLLVCPEPLGHSQPAGVGIRFLEIARALIAEGHAVHLLSVDAGQVPGCQAGDLSPSSIRAASDQSDVALIQGHVANDFFAHATGIPVVVDLYDPFLVENFHYFQTHGEKVFVHDYQTLSLSLRRGDFFLCASEFQRLFYIGALLMSGRVGPRRFDKDESLRDLIAIVPFGVQPVSAPTSVSSPPEAVLFGGIYDWYDPMLAIDTIAVARKTVNDLTLTFTDHPNPASTPQGIASDARDYVRRQGYQDFVHFEPWVPYESRSAFFARFAFSLITFRPSLETDLAMRTRIFDYLWAGLPVISSPAPGTDPILLTSQSGRVVNSNTPAEIAATVVELIQNPALLRQMALNARSWAASNQWGTLLEPLLEFCRHPHHDPWKTEVLPSPQPARRSLFSRFRSIGQHT